MKTRREPQRIRAMPCKIASCEGAENWRELLKQLTCDVQRVHNDTCLAWLHWHVEHGNDVKVRTWMAGYREAKKENPKAKVAKCPVDPWPNEFGRHLYRYLADRHPTVHKAVRNLVSNKLRKTITGAQQSNGPWKRWLITLSGQGEMPTFSRALPVPFSKSNGTLERVKNGFQFLLRLDRIEVPGRKAGTSTLLKLGLYTKGRHLQWMRSTLDRIADEEYRWMGSQIVWDDGWYVELCYQLPPLPKAAVDPGVVAILRPGLNRPVRFRVGGKTESLRRRGTLVKFRLRALAAQFMSRAAAYKKQSSAAKGHGRKRATQSWRVKLAQSRNDFKDSYTKQFCRDVISRCIQMRAGTLVWVQPEGDWKKTRFLDWAGKLGDWDSKGPGWDWYKVTSLLGRYCEEHGLVFVLRKRGNGKAANQLRKAS